MQVVGVIDLQGGVVVRGVGGRRAEYRPIVSRLCATANPLAVARAFRDRFGLAECYLADLDAIGGAAPAWAVYDALRRDGFRLWVDAGVRDVERGLTLGDAVDRVVVGLETVNGPQVVATLAQRLGEQMAFSLDLHDGRPMGDGSGWRAADAKGIAVEVVRLGVRRLIVLDLARIGGGGGTGTETLCADLSAQFPHLHVTAGGGVRVRGDLLRLRDAGVSAVLVASALHDGELSRADLDAL